MPVGTAAEAPVDTDRTDRAALLASLGLFSGMDGDALEAIAAKTTEAVFPARQPIVRQGEMGNGLFLIVEGRAEVVRDGKVIARLKAGDLVGELSVLDRSPRMANVVAVEPTRCLALAAWDVEALIRQDPRVSLSLLRALARRVRTASAPHEH